MADPEENLLCGFGTRDLREATTKTGYTVLRKKKGTTFAGVREPCREKRLQSAVYYSVELCRFVRGYVLIANSVAVLICTFGCKNPKRNFRTDEIVKP